MISPTSADLGRAVRLPIFGAAPKRGTLAEVRGPDMQHEKPFAMILYEGERMPVSTDMEKLEWDGPPKG